ncbi:ecto-ADP-ribosyltransferase 5-like [Genypterus blacodes]|uniref:ecto-ADP-ribosyltransferase 5-like n=1 Tax=Genypterus blacodes TaxID=154954 RepID=UPI003F761EAE
MPSCQKQPSTCALTSLVLLVGLLMAGVVFVALSWHRIFGKNSVEDMTYDPSANMYDDCRSKASVVSVPLKQNSSTNFSGSWFGAEHKAKEPAHEYMEKRHSISIYAFTRDKLIPVNEDNTARRGGGGTEEEQGLQPRSLYSSLSEALQILKHSQVTCVRTNYRAEMILKKISNRQLRFSSFILGSAQWNVSDSASCFQIHTCFGADVTFYSALRQNRQVLIPPYEVFRVTGIQRDTQSCGVVYRLESNLNCVYDGESNTLHPISAFSADVSWLIFILSCVILVFPLLVFVIVKTLKDSKQSDVAVVSVMLNSVYSPAVI